MLKKEKYYADSDSDRKLLDISQKLISQSLSLANKLTRRKKTYTKNHYKPYGKYNYSKPYYSY